MLFIKKGNIIMLENDKLNEIKFLIEDLHKQLEAIRGFL